MSLCAEHARSYAGGILSQEREVITIQALAGMGRRAEATAKAEQFRRAHPGSAHLRRLAPLLDSEGAPARLHAIDRAEPGLD